MIKVHFILTYPKPKIKHFTGFLLRFFHKKFTKNKQKSYFPVFFVLCKTKLPVV